jgi:addiction module RelE/StbE family toxin
LVYKVQLKKSVGRDLRKINRTQVLTILAKIESELSKTPENCPVLTGKFAGLRKLRVGDYRIIFSILGETVLILRVSHRKEAYR